MAAAVRDRERAVRSGSEKARLQHPVVDLSRCLGCGTCVAACPEDGVLELVHGQAMVVNGARCVGVSACERECPVGAIAVTLGDLKKRDDIPVLTESLEAVGTPGLFLAGEVTAHALVKTAIDHGVDVANEVALRVRASAASGATVGELHDLIIVGAGPAGLACALEARRQGLDFVVLEQEATLGGTVAKYPRAKLVLTQPLELPLAGRFKALTWTKEELIALWDRLAREHELPFRFGESLERVTREGEEFVVRSGGVDRRARFVCLALGRRGTPRKLEVPGEDLGKVAYALIDAQSHRGERIVVVGGGDSAVEAALGLASQPGNAVTLSYRKDAFFRLRLRNEEQLQAAVAAGRIDLVLSSEVVSIDEGSVELVLADGPNLRRERIANDRVFVMVGGTPPFELLEKSGVSFDPTLHRAVPDDLVEQGTGLVRALTIGLALATATLLFALVNLDYYGLARIDRPTHVKHGSLRPGDGTGLALGLASLALIGLNLLYILRRSPRTRFVFGSLRVWMTSHIATGILAFLCALLHAAMSPRNTVGGHAFWLLGALLVTGAIGRYLYAWVPRAANGRELALAEVKSRLDRVSEHWPREQRDFASELGGPSTP